VSTSNTHQVYSHTSIFLHHYACILSNSDMAQHVICLTRCQISFVYQISWHSFASNPNVHCKYLNIQTAGSTVHNKMNRSRSTVHNKMNRSRSTVHNKMNRSGSKVHNKMNRSRSTLHNKMNRSISTLHNKMNRSRSTVHNKMNRSRSAVHNKMNSSISPLQQHRWF
jgi:16S rRNA A1518/A1519 N6-dimethyltransferase RsmA/KsgA/DIM1 with predicted DNA glycosylase/AP lyase activity